MNSGEGLSSIKILTELWKFKLKRDNIDFEAFHSFSKSFKEDGHYNFDFIERFAYDSTVQNRSISFVQEVAKNDIETQILIHITISRIPAMSKKELQVLILNLILD